MGLQGLFRGFASTLLRDVPFNAVYFTMYNVLKTNQIERKVKSGNLKPLSASELLIIGCISGTFASGLTTPADCIKTCIQSGSKEFSQLTLREAAALLYKQGGAGAFFRGIIPRVMIISPLFGITFMCFEMFQRALFPETVE
eukprot:TRINITY_DN21706_c0_g1_i2.p1 TRINITY_DN21706_c0_g1~~TRINITY_DN21706_c0_g1_i2.p1  ORF type:complete len:142 (+),score=42.36 TRINITY_DN21706_c0_g1_i2:132-557(+)